MTGGADETDLAIAIALQEVDTSSLAPFQAARDFVLRGSGSE
ncbi:hypothetical protein [Actinacidiphila yeochonensis]|nr:hypothetical protein [Actinacidiphila yeochonensis]